MANSGGLIANLAIKMGASEPALRLLLSILVGYPLAGIYHKLVRDRASATIKHVFFAVSGFLLMIFNYGYDSYHSLIAIWITYFLIRILYTRPNHLIVANFLFHMTYLLTAYYFTESNEYDINWTMPHCVLVLRLIGLGFDIADGLRPIAELSRDQKQTALTTVPTLLSLAAFTYFPACCLVGPQFPFRRYERFIAGEFNKYTGNVRAGCFRFGLGALYLIIRQIGAGILPDTYFFTAEFEAIVWWQKWAVLGIWGKISLYKYVSCWLIAEGVAICFGLPFVAVKEDGTEDWSACSNIKLAIFERAGKLGHYVQSFNVNTNHWLAEYVYKRLKFLNNRTISYASALLFLALWHGFHTGYYMCFFMEYLVITFEKQIETAYDSLLPAHETLLKSPPVQAIVFALRQIYTLVGMGWCLTPFIFLSYDKWLRVYHLYSYVGFVLLLGWFSGRFIYLKFFRKRSRVSSSDGTKTPSKLHAN